MSQTGEDNIAEHGRSYFTATKSLGLTPGHKTSADTLYRTFDPVGTALLCFRCHSTGPITMTADFRVEPSELGVRCESCHGPGRAHAESHGAASIQDPKSFTAVQISALCGSCHRQASDLDDERDWSNAWNVRHEPAYLHRAACFRNSDGALSCLTCHDPHQPLKTTAASYDSSCTSCHPHVPHRAAVASRSCVSCHMPKVGIGTNLTFTNHWIGIYDLQGRHLTPARRVVQDLHPAPVPTAASGIVMPADPATLAPVYAASLSTREKAWGPDSAKVARAAADFGSFLLQNGNSPEAEPLLRRAAGIYERSGDPAVSAVREALGFALTAQGKTNDAEALFRKAAEGKDPGVAAQSYLKLAELDHANAEGDYKQALASEEKASGPKSERVAALLEEYALALRARKRDADAEPLLRRALVIQQGLTNASPVVTIGVLNGLGNLLEGRHQFDEAEKLERTALSLAEEKLGPESTELAKTCTNLADVLWNKKNLREAGLLYRRAIGVDAALYGPDQPQTAADIANLGMLMNAAGQRDAGTALLRQALTIYENTLGRDSEEAAIVRGQLGK